jgi:peptidyl-prolyl cis-trans isomerase C
MRKGLTFLPSLTLAVCLALPAAAAPDGNTVVARVNGTEITLGHMIVARAGLPEQYQSAPAKALYDAILDQLIDQTTLELARTGSVPRQVELQLENERRSLLAADVIENIMAEAAGDADIQAAYDAKYSDGFGGDEFRAAHILVETEEQANEIKTELDAGADFAKTAQEKSTGPSGPSGGDLGWFGLGQMVPAFETAVVSMSPGEVSEPIKTQFGWHVIILNEKRKQAAPDLASVRDQIVGQLQSEAVENRIEELIQAAIIERVSVEGLTPELIQNLDLLGN